MNKAVVIYPHQLFEESPALAGAGGDCSVYLVEEPLILTHNPIHRQKLMLHKLSMDAYERFLSDAGHQVNRLEVGTYETTASVFEKLSKDGVEQMHICDTTDYLLEQAIEHSGIERVWYDTPYFVLPKGEAIERFTNSKRFMAKFYKELRKDKDILMDGDEPAGGKWSFDEDNREKIPKGTELPEDIQMYGNAETGAAEAWVEAIEAEKYGETGCWLPYTHDGAKQYLKEFFKIRFQKFGPYEDAMTTAGVRLWHSAISPLMNIGLLTPKQVLDEAIVYAESEDVPMNSLEGFVRQIIGWREFIRASYECDGGKMRNKNFFTHKNQLPNSYWDGTTDIEPVDHVIRTALTYGYTHHIDRLMVMGNFMLLSQLHPDEVYRWFMGMYLDAYDWVMVSNVYGMSQFADGGSFATKPYISGSNYIKKMSDYKKGDWEDIWTALYWNFIADHRPVFEKNHRLSMMPKMLDRMSDEKREAHGERAKSYLESLD
jgi:deoxyribodipyrimidine photolyase-related protein